MFSDLAISQSNLKISNETSCLIKFYFQRNLRAEKDSKIKIKLDVFHCLTMIHSWS